jgi:putative membrane protein
MAAAAVLAACATASAAGQEAPAAARDSFAQQAAVANQTDFQIGQLAKIRGHSAQVRQFGQTMMDDHRTALSHFEKAGGVAWPLEIDARHRQLEQELSELNGRAFDKRFVDAMVEDHQAMASLLRQQTGAGDTPAGRMARDTDHTAATGNPTGSTDASVGTTGAAPRSTGERMGAVGTSGGRTGTDSVNWAARELRTVERHLAQAKRLQRSLGGR